MARPIVWPLGILAACALTASACSEIVAAPEAVEFFFSFEEGMEGWTPRAMDLELGEDTIAWSVGTSSQLARHGDWSLRLYLENWNDAGKIWAERELALQPGTRYHVRVTYEFATADPGEMTLFRIITGALPASPTQVEDLLPTYQGGTGTGFDEPVGYRWINHAYDLELETGPDGAAFVLLGVWGLWETPRTYYVDQVHVRFTPR